MAGEKQKAARWERFREVSADSMDIGRGWRGPGRGGGSVVDAAIDEAVATTAERGRVRMAVAERDPVAIQAAQRALSAKKAELRRGQAAGQPQRGRPSVREWLERMSPEERESVERTETFARLSATAQAHLLRVRDDVDEIDARAEALVAQEREDDWLAEQSAEGDLYEDDDEDDFEERLGERRAAELEAESEAVFGEWAESMTVEEAFGLEAPGHEPSLSEAVGWADEEEVEA
jgi:hypothetical protein